MSRAGRTRPAEEAAPTTAWRRPPGRPRDPMAEQRILDAAIEEYLAAGIAGFTMDRVARRAGVGKSTVYLRWPDKDTLLVESVLARSGGIEDVDTGSLRGDLVELAGNLMRFLLDPVGFASLRVAVESVATRPHRRVAIEIGERHLAAATRVFERARARGEHVDEHAATLLTDCIYGAVTIRVLRRGPDQHRAPDDADITNSCAALVDSLLPLLDR
ncbi:MAG: TetR/AcrR family transcriptional regulator [Frankia sp.]|nr:TetR/AcrR family transcriptional regulator [Frankia sp.]